MNQSPQTREIVEDGGRPHGRSASRRTAATAPANVAGLGADTLLHISDLRTQFSSHEGVVKAVDGMDLTVPKGKTVCVVGESGCGKSVTARSIPGSMPTAVVLT